MADGAQKTVHIRPHRGIFRLDLVELLEYRDFLRVLIWRDLKVRYKQTVVGIAWVWFQPMIMMLVYSIFFGYLARFPSGDFPYPLFVLCGIVPWLFLSRTISEASHSLVDQRTMLTRLYFPRLILPLVSVFSSLVDMFVAFAVLFGVLIFYGQSIHPEILLLPLFLLELVLIGAALGILVSGLNAIYRDFGFVVPVLLQVWMFSSPVIYSTELLPAAYRVWYGLNPMVGVLEGIRWSLGGSPAAHLATDQVATVTFIVAAAASAVIYFRKVERTLVDKL